VIAQAGWRRGDGAEALISREWLVTNGLGGYASGTVAGVTTRRYHGLLVAALPNPLGRTMMFNHLSERLRLPDGRTLRVQGTRHCTAYRSAGTGHQRSLARQVEHHQFLPAVTAATSSGLPIAVTTAPSARRLISPLSTLPAPTS